MQSLVKNRATVSAVLLFIVAILAYNVLFNNSAIETGASPSPSALGADLLQMSSELSKATLSQELFSSPSYRNLTDFSILIPQQPVGRTNPFDSIGRE